MTKEKYGFIYVWRDKKYNKYYIGRHWGHEQDGYVCSSNNMRVNYNNRVDDFKRRIVSRIKTTVEDLIIEEQRWLNMIDVRECGKKYYNISISASTPTMRNRKHSEETKAKMSKASKGKKKTKEHRESIRLSRTGITLTIEHRANIGKANKKRDYSDPVFRAKMSASARNRSPETLAKIAANSKRLHAEGRVGRKGPYREQQFGLLS